MALRLIDTTAEEKEVARVLFERIAASNSPTVPRELARDLASMIASAEAAAAGRLLPEPADAKEGDDE